MRDDLEVVNHDSGREIAIVQTEGEYAGIVRLSPNDVPNLIEALRMVTEGDEQPRCTP